MKNTIKIAFQIDNNDMIYNLKISGNSHQNGKGVDYLVNIDKEKLIKFVEECASITKFERSKVIE